MPVSQTLRDFVTARLNAAAEDIFALFERTITEYEEKLGKLQRLEQLPYPRIEVIRGNVQVPSTSPDLGLNQDQIKEEAEEQRVKQEEEQLPVSVPEGIAASVKTEESSLLQQQRTEPRNQTLGENISSETHFHLETEAFSELSSDTDNDDDWDPPFSSAATKMETNANEAAQGSGVSPNSKSAPETSTCNYGDGGGGVEGAEEKKYQCSVCEKSFKRKPKLQLHIQVHTGERPYSCTICNKAFRLKGNLKAHIRTHTGEKPYSCSVCNKTFTAKASLHTHKRLHTGEKPCSCSICGKEFTTRSNLRAHIRTHTGEKPYSCTVCNKGFTQSSSLTKHIRTHTGEKPYGCLVCSQRFNESFRLKNHMRLHTGEKKPFSCTVCKKD